MHPLRRLLTTPDDPSLAVVRLALGLILLPHGAQKLLGLFGGSGYGATLAFFESALGVPPFVTLLVILTESLGALLLVLGLFGRLAAVAVAANMLGAMVLVNLANGFFWTEGGFEFPLLLFVLALLVAWRGSGALSLDRRLARETDPARRAALR